MQECWKSLRNTIDGRNSCLSFYSLERDFNAYSNFFQLVLRAIFTVSSKIAQSALNTGILYFNTRSPSTHSRHKGTKGA